MRGRTRFLRFGHFVGTIRFAGEGRYTEVDARRARGNSYVERPWRCAPRKVGRVRPCRPEEQDEQESDSVELEAGSPHHKAELAAAVYRSPGQNPFTLVNATTEERRGRMEIARAVFAAGAEQIFTYDGELTSATVAPPRPFEGAATFQQSAEGKVSWTGDLRVSLPGARISRSQGRLSRPACNDPTTSWTLAVSSRSSATCPSDRLVATYGRWSREVRCETGAVPPL